MKKLVDLPSSGHSSLSKTVYKIMLRGSDILSLNPPHQSHKKGTCILFLEFHVAILRGQKNRYRTQKTKSLPSKNRLI